MFFLKKPSLVRKQTKGRNKVGHQASGPNIVTLGLPPDLRSRLNRLPGQAGLYILQ